MSATATVELVREIDDEHYDAFLRLLPQLSSSATPLERPALGAVAAATSNRLFFARCEDAVVGFCLLVTFPSPTGARAWLEDVVVDEASRGAGVGSALVAAAVAAARASGARTLDLTSRPSREAANRLYERCGFSRRETNVWRLTLAD